MRDGKLLSIEEAAYKCATLPAKIYNIKDRGTIREGAYADITLIDLPNLKIVGRPEESMHYPKGRKYVFINGKTVVEEGKHTCATPGKILRRMD